MDTLAPTRTCLHAALHLETRRPTEFVDLTDHLTRLVEGAGVCIGTVTVQTRHTTTAIVVNEFEPLLLADFEAMFERIAPRGMPYWHDELPLRGDVPADERRNAHAHCRAVLMPSSAVLTVVDGRLQLGAWQRVLLVEFDGPRSRDLSLVLVGEVTR
ncbi:MAG TPA: secondary thiamine-phosphate synthase enzyme YjbQ [Vicinamibacterales bacterium]|nr:secondary thiamine-phosphate synthase enzyme YjbQ [Vicinamibacterales bacterium]